MNFSFFDFLIKFGIFIIIVLVILNIIKYLYILNLKIKISGFAKEFNEYLYNPKKNHIYKTGDNNLNNNMIMLKDHEDFKNVGSIFNFLYFKNLILGIEEKLIPSDKYFGLCAILVANYNIIRREIMQEIYCWDASHILYNIGGFKNQEQIINICRFQQNILYKYDEVDKISYSELYHFLKSFSLYFVYHNCIEDEKMIGRYFYLQSKGEIVFKNK